MHAIVDAIQDIVTAEPETEVPPAAAQPQDAIIETQLTEEISALWSSHIRLSADHKATATELRQIRASLAERLHAVKSLLCRPDLGRASQWRSWLRQQGIPRSTADRLVTRHAETLCAHDESVLSEAPSEQAEAAAEKLARNVWQRFGKLLTTDESIINFISRIAEISGVHHEWREEGLIIFKPAPKAADGLPGPASATDPAPQSSNEVPGITDEPGEETAATLPVAEQAAAVC